MNDRIVLLRQKAAELPLTPGVYLMKSKDGTVIYVGKSKRLRNRVSNYFLGTHASVKTAQMVSRVYDFETVLCDTEIEALTLENNLIKKYKPKYNIKLKDAKSYPYLKITAEAFPRLIVTRDRKNDGGHYFGPYAGMSIAYDVADTLKKIFRLPSCRRRFPQDIGKERPCIYRQMGRCVAPCAQDIDEEIFSQVIRKVEAVLRGDIRAVQEAVTAEMLRAAEEERFEEAARLRDSITALGKLREKQKAVADESVDMDIVAFFSNAAVGVAAILSVRGGKLLSKNTLLFSADELWEEDMGISFLTSYYDLPTSVPKELLLASDPGEGERRLLSERLTSVRGKRVSVLAPQRGERKKLCHLALKNAEERAEEYCRQREKEDKDLLLLTSMLSLEVVPDRIEAYDISNIGDECITASMVVYKNGVFSRNDYRTFKVRTDLGRDDFASMKEALSRRLSHIGDGSASLGERPDLLLLDGGKGQISAVREAMEESGVDIPLFGMVKDDFHKTRALTDGENEIGIAREPGVYSLIYRLQEEAHRVAYRASQNRKRRSITHSSLEKIPGIGPKKAKLFLSVFGSIAKIREAEIEELSAARGVSLADATAVYRYFHEQNG